MPAPSPCSPPARRHRCCRGAPTYPPAGHPTAVQSPSAASAGRQRHNSGRCPIRTRPRTTTRPQRPSANVPTTTPRAGDLLARAGDDRPRHGPTFPSDPAPQDQSHGPRLILRAGGGRTLGARCGLSTALRTKSHRSSGRSLWWQPSPEDKTATTAVSTIRDEDRQFRGTDFGGCGGARHDRSGGPWTRIVLEGPEIDGQQTIWVHTATFRPHPSRMPAPRRTPAPLGTRP